MKCLRNVYQYCGIMLLMLLAACGPATSTPIANGPILAPTLLPAYTTPLVPIPVGCTPPEVSIDKINSFCANQAAGLGGATFVYHPALLVVNHTSGNVSCNWNQSPVSCWGTQDTKFQEVVCSSCRAPNAPQTYGTFACSKGYAKDGNGNCVATDPQQEYAPCPAGSHYNNDLQNCADDVTGNPASPCPAGYDATYLPDTHLCLANAYPQTFNCQTFTIPLGSCALLQNKNATCAPQSCPPAYNWDSNSCSCVCTSGHC